MTHWDAEKPAWAHMFRNSLATMGNNTNNIIESHFSKVEKVLHQNLSIYEALRDLISFNEIQVNERNFQEHCEVKSLQLQPYKFQKSSGAV